jgi:spermidine synthase
VRTDSVDLVVGDAFGGLSVPWHLTTEEFVGEIRRVLRADGIYLVNVIDGPPFSFARAELRTLGARFRHVATIASPTALRGASSANVVLVASDAPIPVARITELVTVRGQELLAGAALRRFIGDAPTITDDHAPVDQWLAAGRI